MKRQRAGWTGWAVALLWAVGLCAPDQARAAELDVDIYCLRAAYADRLAGVEEDAQGLWLRMADGQRVLYAARGQQPEPLSSAATVAQSMAQPYPLEPERPQPGAGEHPGRVRSQAFLQALYGKDPAAVRRQLQPTELAGTTVLFAGGEAAAALRRVAVALDDLLRQKPEWRSFVRPLGGTFLWRRVAGEERLSAHSFGVAVDLNPARGAYWRWSGGRSHPGQRSYPSEIVAIFEANGFVWGGKWYEYDLMHFEYRPELICKAHMRRGLTNEASP